MLPWAASSGFRRLRYSSFRSTASPLFTEAEKLALEYADSMTITDRDVTDDLFARLRESYDDDSLVELTTIIAWENSSSKFNRALRVESQGLWRPNRDPSHGA